MKLKMQRLSGEVLELPEFRAEFTDAYDKAELACRTMDDPSAVDQISLAKTLDIAEATLRAKYGLIKDVELPKNDKQWHALVAENGPIMVAKSSADPDTLVLIIIDMPIG